MAATFVRRSSTRRSASLLALSTLLPLAIAGCSGDAADLLEQRDAAQNGGGAGSGGTTATVTASGGEAAGGRTGSGGTTSTGERSGSGGTTGTGGVTSASDAGGSGGATTTAMVAGQGGGARTGGNSGRASTAGTGGIARTGGASGSGGVTARGGAGGSGVTGGATGGSRRDAGSDLASNDARSPNTGTDATYPVATGKPTVYLAGDSTVQTYSASQAPQQGWGQRIAEFFTSDVIFVNKSMGGRSSKSFIDEGRLTEIEGLLKTGDYLFAQWGINDRYKSDPDRYTDPATTFRTYLKQYIDAARGKNAIPVLVTPTPRLDYTNGVFQNGFVDYCTAIEAVAQETNTPMIDLQTMGLEYYTSIGYDAVVATISLPGPDVLHFRDTGAYQMARLVARGVRDIDVPISPFVLQDKL